MGQEQMRHLAETDPLTNCFNRRALMEKLEQEMDRAARYATMLTGMMIDIDNFKQINDTHGHLVGDRVLKQLANLLKREQRSVDIVARYGGEEFVVLLPETTARRVAQLRRAHPAAGGDPRIRRAGQAGAGDHQHRHRLLPRRAGHRRRVAAPPGRHPPLPRQERRPEPVPRLSTRRCPRCQTTYPAPARYCVKDGSPLVDAESTAHVRAGARPPAAPGRSADGVHTEESPSRPRSSTAAPR